MFPLTARYHHKQLTLEQYNETPMIKTENKIYFTLYINISYNRSHYIADIYIISKVASGLE